MIEKAGGRAKVALVMHHAGVNAARAKELLVKHKGSLRAIVGDVGGPGSRRRGRRLDGRRARRRRGAMTDDPLARLLALRERPRRIVIGLLSGTSADGTDAALCEIAGFGENTGLVARSFVTTPFPRPLRERIYRVSQADDVGADRPGRHARRVVRRRRARRRRRGRRRA